jgi:glycosyl hydrolase family 113
MKKENNMKKVFAILFIITIIVSACNSSSIITPSQSVPTSIETQVPPTVTATSIPSTPTITPIPPTPTLVPESDFIKGITLNYSSHGPKIGTTGAEEVIQQYILPSGANYVALIPSCWSVNMSDTSIVCSDTFIEGGVPPVTDAELIRATQYLHSVGLRVVLKPQALIQSVHITESEAKTRYFTKDQWKAWFDSYTTFITHYAQLAEDNHVDLFVVGNEQEDNTQKEQEWRAVIAAVRNVYHGPITYAANAWQFEASHIKFWDALDYIGTNGYQFGMLPKRDPTLDDRIQAWQPYVKRLEEMSKQYGKQVIITEIGALAMQDYSLGITNGPQWIPTSYDGQEQADYYTAFFEALKDKPWLKGIILWDVETEFLQGGANDMGHTFIAKPAEQVVHKYFGGSPITPTPVPNFIEEPSGSSFLYQDILENEWSLWYEPSDTAPSKFTFPEGYQSSYSVLFPLSKYPELVLASEAPIDYISQYKWIEFYIKVGQHHPKTLLAMFEYWTPEYFTFSRKAAINSPNYIEGGQFQPGTWQRVRIPLIDFGITDQKFNQLHIMSCLPPCSFNDDKNADDVYIDNIRLVAGKSP